MDLNPKLPQPTLGQIYEDADAENNPMLRAVEPRKFTGYGPCNSAKSAVAARLSTYLVARLYQNDTFRRAKTERHLVNQVLMGDALDVVVPDVTTRIAYSATVEAQQLGHPTFFVSPAFLEAAMATSLPPGVPLSEIHWPLDAMTFVLPKGALISPSDGECTFISISHSRAEHQYPAPFNLPPVKAMFDTYSIYTAAERNGAPMFAASVPLVGLTTDNWHEFDYEPQLYVPAGLQNILSGRIGGIASSLEGKDHEFLTQLQLLGLKLLLILSAEPQIIVEGRLERPSHTKKGKERPALWAPNIIGPHYEHEKQGSAGTGTHASPRLHWRRGHLRMQSYGPRETPAHRPKWIKPMLINVE